MTFVNLIITIFVGVAVLAVLAWVLLVLKDRQSAPARTVSRKEPRVGIVTTPTDDDDESAG